MRCLVVAVSAALLVSAAAGAQYESSYGIEAVQSHLHPGLPISYQFSFDFSHGPRSFAGAWKAVAGGGKGDSAAVERVEGTGAESSALKFTFDLRPGGDLWALLHFVPGGYSAIRLTPEDGFCFRARTHGVEMDGYDARWYLQIRVIDEANRCVTYRTEDFAVKTVWKTYYVTMRDFGRSGRTGVFAAGDSRVRLYDVAFIPNTEKYRHGDLTLDAFLVYGPGPKVKGVDTDGDGVPDPVDGDDDNDGVLDFARSPDGRLAFTRTGHIQGGGRWTGRFVIAKKALVSGDTLEVDASIEVESEAVVQAIQAIPEVVGILCGERRYDQEGRYHGFSNHMISALLTPTGLPIENFQPLVPSRHVRMSGVTLYASPIDAACRIPLSRVRKAAGSIGLDFSFRVPVTARIPEGHYRLFFEFGVVDADGNFLRLSALPGVAFRQGLGRPGYRIRRDENLVYEKKIVFPLVRIGEPAVPRMPWAVLFDTEVHGVRGEVPEEEKGRWAMNARNRLRSRPIYPKGKYNLEPGFPSFAYESLNITYPLNPRSGRLTVQVTRPDGRTVDLGSAPFAALTAWGATTRTGRFYHDFDQYGEYRIHMTGWILDAYGNRFEGGGTYRIWIAERITFGTFPSRPYVVGHSFLSAVEVVPPLPAEVTLSIDFYPYSDPSAKETFSTTGRANRLGLFVAPKRYVFEDPGEYLSRLEGKYVDKEGRLWMGSLWGAMVVAEKDSPLIAHGGGGYMENGEFKATEPRYALGTAGSAESRKTHFVHYPFLQGDVLHIPSTMDHMNAIFPVLTVEFGDGFVPYGETMGRRPVYPLLPTTWTGNSPFCFPEQINRIAYFYADGWRPGVSGRHIIGTAQTMNSYWSVSPSLLGRQMHASRNGDLPGDFYRFTGGVVYRDLEAGKTGYAIYKSMGAVSARDDMNTRVVAPGQEPLLRLNGRDHYLFLGGGVVPVPGMIMPEGSRIPSGGTANPPVPAELETTVIAPSGREFHYKLEADRFGVFARMATTLTPLTEPGVWRARQKLSYGGKTGDVLGSEDGEYCFYVIPADRRAGFELDLDLPEISTVGPGRTVRLEGALPEGVREGVLHYTAITPGLILEEGHRPATEGRFCYEFDPWKTGRRVPFFDTVDHLTGRPVLCDTVVFSLFFEGRRKDGSRAYGFRVVAMRGDRVLAVKTEEKPGENGHPHARNH